MKRSTRVALTLLIPAMAAFGCSQGSSSLAGRAGASQEGETAADCEVPAQPGEPEKPKCSSAAASHHHQSTNGYHRRGWGGFFLGGWGAGRHSYGQSRSPGQTAHSTSPSHASNSVVHGGFGHTGSHLSGGS